MMDIEIIDGKNIMKKDSTRRKIRPFAILLAVCIAVSIIAPVLYVKNEDIYDFIRCGIFPERASEEILRKSIANQLKKSPNKLTSEDYKKLDALNLIFADQTIIKSITKLKNLQTLE